MRRLVDTHESDPDLRARDAICALMCGFALPASAAAASLSDSTHPLNDETRDYLLDHPEIAIVDDSVLTADQAVVVDDSGRSTRMLSGDEASSGIQPRSALGGCDYWNAVFVNVSGWQQSVDGCGVIGWNSAAKWSYHWTSSGTDWQAGPSCVQGRGYYISKSVKTPRWHGAGCGSGGRVTVNIGNRATVAKIRGHVQLPGQVGYVRWK